MRVIKQTDKRTYTVITFTNQRDETAERQPGDATEPVPDHEVTFQTCRTYINGNIHEDMGLTVTHNLVAAAKDYPGGVRAAYVEAMAHHGQLVGITHPCSVEAVVAQACSDLGPDDNPF